MKFLAILLMMLSCASAALASTPTSKTDVTNTADIPLIVGWQKILDDQYTEKAVEEPGYEGVSVSVADMNQLYNTETIIGKVRGTTNYLAHSASYATNANIPLYEDIAALTYPKPLGNRPAATAHSGPRGANKAIPKEKPRDLIAQETRGTLMDQTTDGPPIHVTVEVLSPTEYMD